MQNHPLMNNFKTAWLGLLGAMLLSSCTAFYTQAPKLPDVALMEPTLTPSTAIDPQWWKQLNDAQLNQLIDQALQNSPSLKTADTRIENAKAMIAANRSVLFPQIGINTQLNRQELSKNYIFLPGMDRVTSYGLVSLNFDWSLDLWGKQKHLLDGSKYRFVSAQAQLDAAKLGLTMGIVSAYIEFDYAMKVSQLAQTDVAASSKLLEIARERYQKGLIDQVMLQAQEVDHNTYLNQLVMAQKMIALLRHQIAALVGQGPSFGEQIRDAHLNPQGITQTPLGKIPSDLVARRPDLQGLLSQIYANHADLKAAHLDYLPSFDLVGNVGFQAFGLSQLINSNSQIYALGPVINLPIFNAGKIDANVSAKSALTDQAIADYSEQLIVALKESADGITGVKAASAALQYAEQNDRAAKKVFDIYQQRFHAGLMSKEQIEKAKIDFDRYQVNLVLVEKNVLNAHLQLIQALGGGYIANDSSQQLSSQH